MQPVRQALALAARGVALLLLTACLDGSVIIGPSSPPPVQISSKTPSQIKTEVVNLPLDRRQVEGAALETWIHTYTNEARVENGLPALAYDNRLAEVARAHSQHMVALNFFDHLDPEGRTHQQRLDERYPRLVRGSGENIARYPVVVGSDQDLARRIVEGWMNSPGHRANILRPGFTAEGIGVAQDGSYLDATQVFAAQLRRR